MQINQNCWLGWFFTSTNFSTLIFHMQCHGLKGFVLQKDNYFWAYVIIELLALDVMVAELK